MKLHQLKALLNVIETGSFSEAALRLELSQASVSHAVAELERELGIRLLERGRFGARATQVGLKIAHHASGVLKLTEVIEQEAQLELGITSGMVRITCFRSAAGKIIPRVIRQLRHEHPELKVEIFEIDDEPHAGEKKRQRVRTYRADFAFINEIPENDKDLIFWELSRDPFLALLPITDPRDSFVWQDVPNYPVIYDTHGSKVKNHLEALGIEVTPAYAVGQDSTIVRMVSEGLGIAFLAKLAIDELPSNVKAVPIDDTLERTIYVAILPSSLKVPAVRAFLKVLKTHYPESELPDLTSSSV